MAQAQRIARSYLTELFMAAAMGHDADAAEQLVAHLMGEAASVEYRPRRDRLVLTFDLAEKAEEEEEEEPVPYVPAEPLPQESPAPTDADWIGRDST